ncbi:MAG: UDP-3-O-(3-hydroxymyristoyl)glucosamine N-acyltransferase [Halothiobacillaceae bacterium]|nr:MAG: UDP-3-O-(3-hydroxymyristoyl)glucosamine N-acyltransferase [Halothiobacillaceae bacterium]
MAVKLGTLAEHLGVRLIGDPDLEMVRASSLEKADAHSIVFIQDEAYLARLDPAHGAAVILPESWHEAYSGPRLISETPQLSFARAARLLHPRVVHRGIHPSAQVDLGASVSPLAWIGPGAVISAGAKIMDEVQVGPLCFVGENSEIGAGTELVARVTIMAGVRIGARCMIHPGAVIGADGFGLAHARTHWERVPQLGGVLVGDDVDIGANTTVDRGALEDTVIGHGVKIDNLVQIAHNVEIGPHTAIAGCAGLAGSSKVGSHCMLAGGVGLAGHLEIADGVQVTGMSMVTRSIRQAGIYSAGTPLDNNRNWRRNAARFKQLDAMARRIEALERLLNAREFPEE